MKHADTRRGDLVSTGGPEPGPRGEIEFSILMPCLNEVRTLGTCIKKAQQFLKDRSIIGEILVADNGSTDGSVAVAEELGARVVQVAELGYGSALAGGIAAARGHYIIMGDSDDSYDFSDLSVLVNKLLEGNDLVIGNRFQGGIGAGAMPFLHRYVGNPLLTAIGKLFFGSRSGDFYCGLRGFRRSAVVSMRLQSKGMEFALEMLIKATMMGMRISEVPIRLEPDGRGRPPHLRTWRDGWRSLRFLLLFTPRWLFLYPGLALLLVGAVLTTQIVLAPGTSSETGLDLQIHVFAVLTFMVGFEAVFFSVIGKFLCVVTGLHPPNQRVARLVTAARLEYGITAGILVTAIGLGASIYLALKQGPENLGPMEAARFVVPAALCLGIGVQVLFTSFFLGIGQLVVAKCKDGSGGMERP